ncbi:acetylornithine deacetylase/succinyl-diaminopimelate desuccinylase-like protein [Propionibacteriaceae bacterium ES.041]|uniref:dipeptidase n=1 Tax=Enemella evansiae TaxID=2016499 RepID=UPI000B962EC5|nr:dipeptidase [Enemella evansiae]OYN93977.1 dipeptidase [Enemella evansiae]PFG68748.1 acetylornithine deacetylase/succinyl-diaminopimelate desuccinylase-like protein [Propionibacteriaceae bacterium ES.041]
MSDVLAAVDRVLPSVRTDLAELIAIPSVSADPERAEDVRRSADFVADKLRELGAEVEILSADGGRPAVIGKFPAPEGKPTVTLYAHHDVQPPGDETQWASDPFTATERDGRLYARGAADDKGGFGVHLAALRAFDGKPPVGVTVFVEGEEEIGSPSLDAFFAEHGDRLACDVFVIADSGNWDVGQPAFTTRLRGMTDLVVEVSTLDHGLHSGQYGGVAPDALMALTRILASLHDDAGNVAVQGLVATEAPDLDYPEDRLRAEAGLLDGVEFIGEGPLVQRMWTKPAITVIGIDTTPVARASNTLIPSARAKISVRLAAGDDPAKAQQLVADHLRANAPWGARVEVTMGEQGSPSQMPLTGPYAETARRAYAEAWGTEVVEMGLGGSIPLAAAFMTRHPDALVLATAVVDPTSRMHSTDESLHLGDFRSAAGAEALFLERLAQS